MSSLNVRLEPVVASSCHRRHKNDSKILWRRMAVCARTNDRRMNKLINAMGCNIIIFHKFNLIDDVTMARSTANTNDFDSNEIFLFSNQFNMRHRRLHVCSCVVVIVWSFLFNLFVKEDEKKTHSGCATGVSAYAHCLTSQSQCIAVEVSWVDRHRQSKNVMFRFASSIQYVIVRWLRRSFCVPTHRSNEQI